MKNNVGIWIDSKKAVIVKLSQKETSTETILSNIQFRERIEGETKKYGRFGGHYLTFEKNRKNKKKQQIADFLKIVVNNLEDFDSLVIFGPSKMKKRLKKAVENSSSLAPKLKDTITCDSLTDKQITAKVVEFFH